jgi:beta-glucosidase
MSLRSLYSGVLVVLLVCLLSAVCVAQTRPLTTPEIDARIDALLARMTLEEKAGQLNQFSAGMPTGPGTGRTDYGEMLARGQIGSLFNVTGANQVNAMQRIAVEKSRLKIPLVFGLDVIHGYRTIFPIPLGLAATWDTTIVEKASRVAAEESAAAGIRWTFSPMVDIARDARWGRIAESGGEDPYLGSAMARAYVRGYQGERLSDPTSIAACAKHFVGYGAAEGGRDYNTTEIPERLLRQVYLPPFHAAADEGAATFMSAFNSLNGVPSSANPFTLSQVLRKEWNYKGMVVSDWTSIDELRNHGIANDGPTAARKALEAGVDMDMESNLYEPNLPKMVRSGAISQTTLDEAVRRVLRFKFALGLFEHPYADESIPTGGPIAADRLEVARTAAEKSFVLLKNDAVNGKPLLPLTVARGGRIALIGPLADRAADMLGSWSAKGEAADVVTLRSALQERATKEQVTLFYAKGTSVTDTDEAGFAEALKIARQSDVVVMALGERGNMTGEAMSRTRLDLPGNQQKLLETVVATGKPVVLLVFSGRPLAITWAAQHVPAILQAWFPGVQAGPALVRTMFGDANPSGRLPVSFPHNVGQEPFYYSALPTGRPAAANIDLSRSPETEKEKYVSRYIDETNAPLFAFGHGLCYTTFSYSAPMVSLKSISAKAMNHGSASPVIVTADVKNTGARTGEEVVQLYIRLRGTSVSRPVRELRGIKRIQLAPGESQRVQFEIGADELSFWNIDIVHTVEPATVSVWVSPDSAHGEAAEFEIVQ